MNRPLKHLVSVLFIADLLLAPATAQQPPIEPPTPANFKEEWAYAAGKSLYVWAYAMVNLHNRRTVYEWAYAQLNTHHRQQPVEGKQQGSELPVSPLNRLTMLTDYIEPDQRFIASPNQDVTYGLGFTDLSQDGVVIQIPDFGPRYWTFELLDQRSDVFGSPGMRLNSKPGHYLIVGPLWQGQVPDGIVDVYRSPTRHAVLIPRVFMDDTAADRAAMQPLINQIMAYPLSEYTGEIKITNWKETQNFPAEINGQAEIKWVQPELFWEQLPTVLDEVPPLEGEQAIYFQARQLIEMADSDPAIQAVLQRSAVDADKSIVQPMFYFRNVGEAFGNGWAGARNGGKFGLDYLNRTAVAKAYMLVNLPEDAFYLATDDDGQGRQLDGMNDYTITFAKGQLPPVDGFWSLTVYDQFHFFAPNPIDRYSLGTKNKSLQYEADGSLTLHLQHDPPLKDQRANWLPVPSAPFGLMLRFYLADESVLNKTWQTPAVVRVESSAD